ncbi:MAG: hypothetical protein ABJK20_11935 [Halieaceae bacterium]
MELIAFDTLKCAQRLIAAGVPESQANVQAEVMAEAFVYNSDAVVTKDYFEATLDARFAQQEANFEKRFAQIDAKFKLVFWLLGIIMTVSVIPTLHLIISGNLFTG